MAPVTVNIHNVVQVTQQTRIFKDFRILEFTATRYDDQKLVFELFYNQEALPITILPDENFYQEALADSQNESQDDL